MKREKRIISWMAVLCIIFSLIPAASFAAWEHGDKGTADFTKILLGKDGKEYYINENVKTLFYNSDGSKKVKPGNGRSKVRWRYLKISDKTDGTSRYGYCVEFGAGFDDTAPYKAQDSSKDKKLFQNLTSDAQRIIAATLCYGRNGSRKVPVSSANDMDYYFATQVLIWEAQQGLRTISEKAGAVTGTRLASAHGMSAKHMYQFLKGRPAEKCYDWLVDKVNDHLKTYSFASSSKASAPVHLLKHDTKTGKWSVTLTDSSKKKDGFKLSDDRIKVTKSGYTYTLESAVDFKTIETFTLKNKMTEGSSSENLLVWNCISNNSNQSLIMGSKDLTHMYFKVKTKEGTSVTLEKQDAETEKAVTKSPAYYQIIDAETGKTVAEDLKTDERGKAEVPGNLYPGKYQLKETRAPEGYRLQEESQTFQVTDKPLTVIHKNSPQKGVIRIEKKGTNYVPSKEKMETSENPLEGAVFEITAAEDIITGDGTVRLEKGGLADTLTTDSKGNASSKELYLGNYNIVEKKAPDGYLLSEKTAEVSLLYAGQEKELAYADITLINEQETGSVEISKTDVSTGEVLPDTGIEILDKDKNVILQGRTDSKGKLTFHKLPVGNYYFREFDAPKGYLIDESPYPFEIKENGDIVKCQMTNKAAPSAKQPEKPAPGSPQTGDDFSLWICIIPVLISAIVIFIIFYRRRRY